MSNRVSFVAIFAVFLMMLSTAQAVVVTQWDFNSNPPDNDQTTGTLFPAIGSGTISLIGAITQDGFKSGDGSTDPAPNNIDGTALQTTSYPVQGTGNKTAGINVAVSTLGYEEISVLFDLRTSNKSSKYYRAQYSTDGINFIDFASSPFVASGGDNWNNSNSVDLSSIAEVNDNANFAFRVVSEFAPSASSYTSAKTSSGYDPTGTYRFDMIIISGNAIVVPEANSLILLVLAGVFVSKKLYRRFLGY